MNLIIFQTNMTVNQYFCYVIPLLGHNNTPPLQFNIASGDRAHILLIQ